EAERQALAAGKSRAEAIAAAYDRFYRGDIANELVAATQAAGGLITMEDLDQWRVRAAPALMTTYRDVTVYKPDQSVQGPVKLQTLNILEQANLKAIDRKSTRL